jgi:hypothetical protein
MVQVSPSEPVEGFMMPFKATRPLQGTIKLKDVVSRFFNDAVVPIVDEWGSCTGLLHREDCNQVCFARLPFDEIVFYYKDMHSIVFKSDMERS